MLVIGIAGGSGSGKTTVVKAITEKLKNEKVGRLLGHPRRRQQGDLSDL